MSLLLFNRCCCRLVGLRRIFSLIPVAGDVRGGGQIRTQFHQTSGKLSDPTFQLLFVIAHLVGALAQAGTKFKTTVGVRNLNTQQWLTKDIKNDDVEGASCNKERKS